MVLLLDIPCLWIRFNIVKMSVMPNSTYKVFICASPRASPGVLAWKHGKAFTDQLITKDYFSIISTPRITFDSEKLVFLIPNIIITECSRHNVCI